jgi:DNA-binding GntR family transcriptional regulator
MQCAFEGTEMGIDRLTIAEQVLDYLRQEILDLRVCPGDRLNETRIAEELEVSRTPVREALRMLEAEGLVERGPSGRVAAAARSLDDMLDAFEARVALESYTARLVARKATQAQLEQLEAIWCRITQMAEDKDRRRLVEATTEFHVTLREIGGNPRINAYIREINNHIRVYRSLLHRSALPVETQGQSHRLVLDALCSRDEDIAGAAMREHLLRSMEILRSLWKG